MEVTLALAKAMSYLYTHLASFLFPLTGLRADHEACLSSFGQDRFSCTGIRCSGEVQCHSTGADGSFQPGCSQPRAEGIVSAYIQRAEVSWLTAQASGAASLSLCLHISVSFLISSYVSHLHSFNILHPVSVIAFLL